MYGVLLFLVGFAGGLFALFGLDGYIGEAFVESTAIVTAPTLGLGLVIPIFGMILRKGSRWMWWAEAYLVSLLEAILLGCGTIYALALLAWQGKGVCRGWPYPFFLGSDCFWRRHVVADSVIWAVVVFALCFCFNRWLVKPPQHR
jgi:hypothetical protein